MNKRQFKKKQMSISEKTTIYYRICNQFHNKITSILRNVNLSKIFLFPKLTSVKIDVIFLIKFGY